MKTKNQLLHANHLKLTPQLQYAIHILKISTLELKEELQTAVDTNPMLELKDYGFQVNKINQHHYQFNSTNQLLNNITSPSPNYRQLILKQLEDLNLTYKQNTIAIAIIDSINSSGLLSKTIEDIKLDLEELPLYVSDDEIKNVLAIIQKCEPIGIGARTLQESLILQINNLGYKHQLKEITYTILTKHFHLIATKNKNQIRILYQLDIKTVNNIFKLIQSLNPRPTNLNSEDTSLNHNPDLYIAKENKGWVVHHYANSLPSLKINQHYTNLIDHKYSDEKTNYYLKKQLQEANWLLKSIEHRNKTLLRVGQSIMSHQSEFLKHGEIAISPLTLQNIAEEIDMHESTISRATTNKYIATPKGVYELKYFFSSQLNTLQGGYCSSRAIKAFIKEIINHERSNMPLSDEKISCLLSKEGIIISRRTVTKYRKLMQIGSASERKNSLKISLKQCKLLYKP